MKRKTMMGGRLLLSTWLWLLLLPQEIAAQQQPNPAYGSGVFEPDAFYRQNVCSLQAQLHNKTISLEKALKGLRLRPILSQSEFFRLTPEGTINETYPGLTAVLLDELARRGEFSWRNTFAVMDSSFVVNRTWNDLLVWSSNAYDVTVDWWAFSTERAKMGITFPEGWYDATIIMVGKQEQDDKDSFSPWSWTRPFDSTVWGLIVITLFFSGAVYWILENIDKNSDKQNLETNMIENVWLSAITFTTHFEFRPRSNAARLFTLSLSFWSMLVAAAYTANLASFLVVRNSPSLQVDSVEHAVSLGLSMCVWRSTAADSAVTKVHPSANLVRKDSLKEVFDSTKSGDCDLALTTVSTWQFWERDETVNGDCNMFWVGRAFKPVPAGFATVSDSGTFCTSLITDVLNLHMLEMKEEGFVEDAWNRHIEQGASVDCQKQMAREQSADSDSDQLNVQNMGGVFFFHGMLSALALVVAAIYKLTGWDKIPRFAKTGPLSRSNVRQRMASMMRKEGGEEAMSESDRQLYVMANKKAAREVVTEISKSRRNLFGANPTEAQKQDKEHIQTLERIESVSCSSEADDEEPQGELLTDLLDNEIHGPAAVAAKPAFPDRRKVNFSEPTANDSLSGEEEERARWQEEQTRNVQEMQQQIAQIMSFLEKNNLVANPKKTQ